MTFRTTPLLAVILLAASGCDDPPKRPTDPDALRMDSPFSDQASTHVEPTQGPEFSDEDFVLKAKESSFCEPEAPFLPAPGFRRISVLVAITAKTDRMVPTSPLAFTLQNEKGHTFGATLAGCKTVLPTARLQDGKAIEGDVAFDIPDGEERLELTFEPFLIGRPRVRARVLVPLP